jgi:hypothetical protein
MGFLDKLTGKAKREEARVAAEQEKKRKAEERKAKRAEAVKSLKKTAKDLATEKGEPYVNIVSIELDPENIGNGAIELDWNEFFVAKLIRAGYQGRDDQQIVDQWFQDVCRNVVLETFEQFEANNPRPTSSVQKKDLGDGRSEFS